MAILAISGRAGSGKDTVGRIIQYICWCESVNSDDLPSFEEWNEVIQNPLTSGYQQRWQIKKFAYKLKQIVALLTGCTVEDLESQEFKVKKLGPEWTKFNKNWIYEGEIIKTAEASNLTVKELLDKGDYEHIVDDMYRATFMDTLDTYRELLQKVGTDALRNVIHEEIWVNALMADYGKYINQATGQQVLIDDYLYYKNGLDSKAEIVTKQEPNWIITDMRFPNEAVAVESRGGITIRVNRDNGTRTIDLNPHQSETALDNHKFKYVIDNDGSLSDLVDKVKEILILEKII